MTSKDLSVFGRRIASSLAVVLTTGVVLVGGASADVVKCVSASGNAGAKCLTKGAKILAEKIGPTSGYLIGETQKTAKTVVASCLPSDATTLGYLHVPDVTNRTNDACTLFAYDMNATVYSEAQVGLTAEQVACRTLAYKWATKVRKVVVASWGKKCILAQYQGKVCDRAKRDQKIDKLRSKASSLLEAGCGADFDAVMTFDGATLSDRTRAFIDVAIVHGKHYAQRVYPPNDMGPTAEFGPHPIGIKTLQWLDADRSNVQGNGPRPVTVEVYYPSTDAAIAGVPQEVVTVLGLNLATIPAYRDVDLAPGTYPVVVFSHGNLGIRTQSFFFAGQLASHGFVVVSPDHHGNTFPDNLAGVVDPDPAVNRPLDVSFVIDQVSALNGEAMGFFQGALDLDKVGVSGHSFGGYTSFAVAGGAFALGAFTDARVKAIFPQTPAAFFFEPDFFQTIGIPTLIVGGTIDETTPFDANQQYPFDNLPSGASIVGLAEVVDAGHFTFSSFCEVNPQLLSFLGGFDEACEPRHLPWRHAQDITKYLALNFFDAVLNGNSEALARLNPAVLAGFEDLVYQSK
jgi:predicted dienelactone hydrolase